MPTKRKADAFDPVVDAAKEPLSRDNLKAACWCTVAMIAKEEESQGLSIAVSEAFVASLGELVFQQALSLGKDLEAFAAHANRSTIEADDVKLAVRRNEPLYSALTSSAQRHGITLSTSSKSGDALARKSAKPATTATTTTTATPAARARPRVSKAAQAASAAKRASIGQLSASTTTTTKSKAGNGNAGRLNQDSDEQSLNGSGSGRDDESSSRKTAFGGKTFGGSNDHRTKEKKKAGNDTVNEKGGKSISKAKAKSSGKNSRAKGKATALRSSASEDDDDDEDGEGLGSGFDSDDSDDPRLESVKKKSKV